MSGRRVAEELLMVEREVGDAGDQRLVDDIGRIEPAAEPDFEDAGVGRRPREGEQRDRGRDFEEARLDPAAASITSASSCRQRLVLDQAVRRSGSAR